MTSQMSIKHIAIIMDGNGRWAQERAHRRVWGHIRGAKIVSQIVEEADDLGVEALTLYTFSSENWARPIDEIRLLFTLLKKFLIIERSRIITNNIHFRVMGDISALPEATQNLIRCLEAETKNAKGMKLNFAFNYGGRSEITSAVNKLKNQIIDRDITEEDIQSALYLPDLGDIDLMIRTGGDQRISNFMLWQAAYAELYFTSTKWPDFTREEFRQIIMNVVHRERRFGGVCAANELQQTACLAKKNRMIVEQRSFQ